MLEGSPARSNVSGWSGLIVVLAALGRSLVRVMTHRVRFSRVAGQTLTMEDGMQFTVFRHVKVEDGDAPATAFIVRFTPARMSVRQNIRFSLLPMIPLLGMRGFREKYWCVNEVTGMCQGVYGWQTVADAEAYARSVALRFMTARSAPGSVSHRIIDQSRAPYWVFMRAGTLRLPKPVTACLFDLDGVLTQTAAIHAVAWKEMFDGFLLARAEQRNEAYVPFDADADYARYVDGKPRYEGVSSFLDSRGIRLPQGAPGDPPTAETVAGLGNRKNEIVLDLIRHKGVQAYDGSIRFVRLARTAGMRCGVVSSSNNCREVLEAAGIADLFDVRVDGRTAERRHLRGKPAPDTFLAAADALGEDPASAAVFEDSLAGVEAGRAGGFALVVGLDRIGQRAALRAHGADVVVSDLAELAEAS
jgi:beta-phosphoglucomutase family hydrolase